MKEGARLRPTTCGWSRHPDSYTRVLPHAIAPQLGALMRCPKCVHSEPTMGPERRRRNNSRRLPFDPSSSVARIPIFTLCRR